MNVWSRGREHWAGVFGLVIVTVAGTLAVAETSPAVTSRHHSDSATRPSMSAVVAQGSRVLKDVAYAEGGGAQQRLDIYAPANAKALPVVIFIHGGEWTKGDKSEVSYKPKFLNEHGVVFVSVNYRLSGTAKHPAQVDDVARAVRWIRDHAGEFGGDPQRLILMGHSAGCHLVALVGLDPRPLAKVNLTPSDLCAVVSWSGGAFDLVGKVRSGGMYAGYIRINFGEDERAWRDASPIAHVGGVKPTVRFLFASAENGNPGSRVISEQMVSLIRQAGGNARAVLLSGKTHFTANHEVGMPGDKSGEMLLRFIDGLSGSRGAAGGTSSQ